MKKKPVSSRRNFIQHTLLSASALTVGTFTSAAASFIESTVEGSGISVDTGSEKVLFSFDDQSIPWQHNLRITLVEASKHPGNPVLRRGPAGSPDQGHAILYGTVIKTGDRFRMWYLAMHETTIVKGQAPGNWRPMCYAESKDGIHWKKPDLGLVEFNGNSNNNICLIEGTPHSLTRINDFLSVLYEPDSKDPDKRYKAVYIAHVPVDDIKGGLSKIGPREKTPCVTIAATSADGLRWKVVGDRPADAGGERFEVSSLYKFGDFYYSTGQLLSPWAWMPDGRPANRVIMVYRSPDFKNWSKAKAFGFARPGQLANPPVKGQQSHLGVGLWNRGNVMVGLYGIWQDGLPASERPPGASHLLGTSVDLGLILSNDGIHYREPAPDFKIIARGKAGEWDDTALLQGHAFVNEGDQTMIWYSHWDTGGKLKNMEIGLATLRRDGFGYLSRQHDVNDAHFLTATLEVDKQTRLYINADGLSADAPLYVELLDHLDRPLEGFSGKHRAALVKDGIRQVVAWPGSQVLPVRKKFVVKVYFPENSTARVYALYLSQS